MHKWLYGIWKCVHEWLPSQQKLTKIKFKKKKFKRGGFIYFHWSLNSLLYLLEHTLLLCDHDCISSSVLCYHTLCGYFILFSLLSMQLPSAWHGRLQEAGTAHLDHKLKTSRSQNTTAASSLTLSALGLSGGLGPRGCVGRALRGAQITLQLSCV